LGLTDPVGDAVDSEVSFCVVRLFVGLLVVGFLVGVEETGASVGCVDLSVVSCFVGPSVGIEVGVGSKLQGSDTC
jgi:hypothetical protein